VKPLFLLKTSIYLGLCLPVSVCSAASNSSSDTSTTTVPSAEVPKPAATSATSVTIPGPLRSFLRMAGISQKISTEEVLPLLARNVAVEGYQGRKDSKGRPTEFLLLL